MPQSLGTLRDAVAVSVRRVDMVITHSGQHHLQHADALRLLLANFLLQHVQTLQEATKSHGLLDVLITRRPLAPSELLHGHEEPGTQTSKFMLSLRVLCVDSSNVGFKISPKFGELSADARHVNREIDINSQMLLWRHPR